MTSAPAFEAFQTGSESQRTAFCAFIAGKRKAFAIEPEAETPEGMAILDELELLETSLSALLVEQFTSQYCQSVIQLHPELESATLAKALQGRDPVKATRHRYAPIHRCEACDGPLSDGVCKSCGHSMRVIDMSDGKAKSNSDTQEKMSQFESDLDILLAISPLPLNICEKAQIITACLQKKGIAVVKGDPIPSDNLREAFTAAKLNQHYIWCNAMGYYLTSCRPEPLDQADRALLREYYQRAIQAFFKRIYQLGPDNKPLMANLWSVQAILKLIFVSSPTLMARHYDFFSLLHTQNPGTEQIHCNIWDRMASEDGWTFR